MISNNYSVLISNVNINDIKPVIWQKQIGKNVLFKINGEKINAKIISYEAKNKIIFLNINNSIQKLNVDEITNERLDKLLCCINYKYSTGDRMKDNKRDFTIIDEIYYHQNLFKAKCNK